VNAVYRSLPSHWQDSQWLAQVAELGENRLATHRHGDLPRWRSALESLPRGNSAARLDTAAPELGENTEDKEALREALMALHPWRKGPLRLGGLLIDAEWRSDWKWDRVEPHVDLRDKRVLDIGCGNGYFGLRMLGAGARLVVGIDPTLLFVMQWLACRHFAGDLAHYVLPLGIEDLPLSPVVLDAVFSMGVLYHRRNPLRHLRRIRSMLSSAGVMVLETLVLADGADDVLLPASRYARMRNVWAVPGTGRLLAWVRAAGFSGASVVDVTPTTCAEQRSTDWMKFESLQQALDPADPTRTVEGHPAPVRAVVVAHC
jgi:tRNA (mo5U34)-methyltransferase